MKFNRQQRGSSHLIVIIVLVVALLGALTFIFLQNFVNQAAEETETTQTTQQTEEAETETAAYLEVPSMGIQVPYAASEDTYTTGEPNEFGAVSVYSSVAAAAGCTYDYNPDNEPAGSIGYVASYEMGSEFLQSTESSEFYRVVERGDMIYVLGSVQNSCGPDEAAAQAQEDAYLRFADQFENLELL